MKKKLRSISGSGSQPKPQVQTVQVQEQQDPPPDAPPPHIPTEARDTLRTAQFARVVDLVGEGEIEGFCYPNGLLIREQRDYPMAVYVNDTPLMNADRSVNFSGIKVGMTYGSQNQSQIYGFSQGMETISSGQRVKKAVPVSVAISNSAADSIIVGVRVGSLVEQNPKTGDITGSTVAYIVAIQLNGGVFVNAPTITVKGKTVTGYIRPSVHKLPKSVTPETDNWVVRITRVTADSATTRIQNDTYFEYVTILTEEKFRYPNSALVATQINASSFGSIPNRGYHLRLTRVLVPSNYDPETRKYTRDPITGELGEDEVPWDGSMYVAWSDNPAWCFYDLCTNKRYGLGENIPFVDKWELYRIARYCDTLVDDGYGDLEPRFTCNVFIQSREEAWKVINDFSSIFRGIAYWTGGTIACVQDRPRDTITQFTNANVVGGTFNYSGTARKARHTVAMVRWNDPTNSYKPKYEWIEDARGLIELGVQQLDLAAFACTSRAQARRLGRWTLISELNETEVVTYRTGFEGSYLKPGDLVQVLDNDRSGTRQGGRILAISVDRLEVTLDRPVDLPVGTNKIYLYSPKAFTALTPGVAEERTPQIDEHTITTAAGANRLHVNLSTALSANIDLMAVFVIKTEAVNPQVFRVLAAEEVSEHEYQITGLEYNESKFDAAELMIDLTELPITDLDTTPGRADPLRNVTVTKIAGYDAQGGIILKLRVSWEQQPEDSNIVSVKVDWMKGIDGNFVFLTETTDDFVEMVYTVAGHYEFRVIGIAQNGVQSPATIAAIDISNTNPLELFTISGLELVGQNSLGQGTDTDFVGKDAKFQWRLNSPSAAPEMSGDEVTGDAPEETSDPYIQDYEVSVWDIASNVMVYRSIVLHPNFVFTQEKNAESVGAPQPTGYSQFRFQVVGRSKFGELTLPASIVVQNPAPSPPSAAGVTASFRAIWVEWINPTNIDLLGVNVYENSVADFPTATLVAAAMTGNRFYRGALNSGDLRHYWLRSVDTFGNESVVIGPYSATTGQVTNTDINNFAVSATKLFTNTVVLTGATWTNNNNGSGTAAGYIAWNAHTLVYNGALYAITAAATNLKYVYWLNGATSYITSNTNPILGDHDFMIATNIVGSHDLAWNGIANQVIGSAYIQNAAIQNAHIADMAADKITAGLIDSQIIRIGGVTGVLKSDNYVLNTTGWAINGDGSAEFNNVVIRGTLKASIINTDTVLENSAYPGKPFKSQVHMIFNYQSVRLFNNNVGSFFNFFEDLAVSGLPSPGRKRISTEVLEPLFGVAAFCLPGCASNPTNNARRVGVLDPDVIFNFSCSTHTAEMQFVHRRMPEGVLHSFAVIDYDYPWKILPVNLAILSLVTAQDQLVTIYNPASAYGTIATYAWQCLTTTVNFANGDTLTIDGKVYTFQTVLTNVNGNVTRGANILTSLQNIRDAINLAGAPGTQYAAAMTLHPTVSATATATQLLIEAKTAGTGGNALAVNSTAANSDWVFTGLTLPASRLMGGRSPSAADVIQIGLAGIEGDGTCTTGASVSYPSGLISVNNF